MPFQPNVPTAEKAWRDKNPLRKWIESQAKRPNGETIISLCEKLQVVRATAYCWMSGHTLPPAHIFVELKTLTKIDFYAWMNWYKRRPQGGASNAETKSTD